MARAKKVATVPFEDTKHRQNDFLNKDISFDLTNWKIGDVIKSDKPAKEGKEVWKGQIYNDDNGNGIILSSANFAKYPTIFPLKDGYFTIPNVLTCKIEKGVIIA